MTTLKYKIGETVMLREIGGSQQPMFDVEIVGIEPQNADPYRIRYHKKGDQNFWFEDVPENRLISFMEIARHAADGQ